jgi:5-methylthioadenosine/S-adenosylhomocysteine deaminase
VKRLLDFEGSREVAERTLIRGGFVVTMDPALGDQPGADVLIEGDRIAAVGRNLSPDGAQVIDASGDIVIPGFVDTHRHTWETPIRGTAPDQTLGEYFGTIIDGFAPKYRPQDVYAGNLWGSLECLNAGVTTLVDWSHIANTPDHADEAIHGLRDAGLRAVYAYGFPNTSLADWWFSSKLIQPEDARRVRAQYFSSNDGRITMAMATRGPGFCLPEVVRHDWEMARDLGLTITVHVGFDRMGGKMQMVKQLHDLELLYAGTTYVHSNHLTDEEWQMVADSGGRISFAPQVELQMGHGWSQAVKALSYGLRPGLSVDVVTTTAGDLFTQMRALYASERARRNEVAWTEDADPTDLLTAREILGFATIDGAAVAGLADRTGSLTPGKKADLVIIDGHALNTAPVIDPVATVVTAADVSNVSTVIVDGRIHKRDGRMLADLTGPRKLVEDSKDFLVRAVPAQPGWVVPQTA